jgi:hypothetical protein
MDLPQAKPEPYKDPFEGIYSGWAGEFSRVYAEATEPPRSFYFVTALTCLGALTSWNERGGAKEYGYQENRRICS